MYRAAVFIAIAFIFALCNAAFSDSVEVSGRLRNMQDSVRDNRKEISNNEFYLRHLKKEQQTSTVPTEKPKDEKDEQTKAAKEPKPTKGERTKPTKESRPKKEEGKTTKPTKEPKPTKNERTKPTKEPTKEPRTKPTKEPRTKPTKEPRTKPTKGEQTNNPTKEPRTKPTKEPLTKPTKDPQTKPTKETRTNPTHEPRKKPTKEPRTKPTKETRTKPTKKPPNRPTNKPTFERTTYFRTTDSPVHSPFASTTPSVSKSPTLATTLSAPTSPTFPPTQLDTSPPTESTDRRKTSPPTGTPISSPNLVPTTNSSTDFPPATPSNSHSSNESAASTARPAAEKTPDPYDPPTTSLAGKQTSESTYSPITVTEIVKSPITELIGPTTKRGLSITLHGFDTIEDLEEWARITASHFEKYYNEEGNESATADVLVQSALHDATVIISDAALSGAGRRVLSENAISSMRTVRRRKLQSPSAEVVYTQSTSYRTKDPTLGIDIIVQAPLYTNSSRAEYILALKQHDAYINLTAVSPVVLPSSENGQEYVADDPDELTAPIGVIIGGVCGVAAVLVLIHGGIVICKRKKMNRVSSQAGSTSAKSTIDTQEPVPSGLGASLPTYGDKSIATIDYDYSKPFGGAGNYSLSDAGGTLGSHTRQTAADNYLEPGADNTIYSDNTFDQAYDGAREELLDIYAPQGKLGVIIDTPDDGAPVVHAIKDTSPIADKVQVGDKLVAVDDEDVRAMTAIKVSKLISRTSNNESRKLTLIRPISGQ